MKEAESLSLDQQYRKLSDRFGAAWTINQFFQGLHKMLMDGVQVSYWEDLHSLYRELQTIPDSICSQSEDVCTLKLNAFRYRLDSVENQILQEDSNISPSLLRLFLQKMRQMDEKILIQMVEFYLDPIRKAFRKEGFRLFSSDSKLKDTSRET